MTPMKMEVKPVRQVTVGAGYTMNIGNFESIRFDYSVTDGVRDGELVQEALVRIETLVNENLMRRVKEESDGRGGGRSR
jgi:hypothetical protein